MTPEIKPTRKSGMSHPDQFAHLKELCTGFLAAQIPESNIVPEAEFSKYIPLFNRDKSNELGEEAITDLTVEYRGRFSLQHPIKIISAEIVDKSDKDAVYYAADKKYHKVVLELPPVFRPLKTLNDLGGRVPSLIDALMTTSARKDKLNLGGIDYCKEVEQAMRLANPESDKAKYIQQLRASEEKFEEMKQGHVSSDTETPSDNNKSRDDTIITDDLPFEW